MGGARRGEDEGHALPVTLEDLYKGKVVTLDRRRVSKCLGCRGAGTLNPRAAAGAVCRSCGGHGAVVKLRQMGMMVQQVQCACDACGGEGRVIHVKDRCPACNGSRFTEQNAPLEVRIEPGMSHKERITFRGQADEAPGVAVPGDVIVLLQQEKHQLFERHDCNLHMTHTITLAEALCGFQFKVQHLDGRTLSVRRARGDITKPGEMLSVVGEGMPLLRRAGTFGDLVITFEVTYPERVEPSQIAVLREALPPPRSAGWAPTAEEEQNTEVCYVNREDLDTLRREIARDEADDEPTEGQQTAGCAAQ